jgi:flagellar protein FliJ
MTQALHTLLDHAEHQRDQALAALIQAENGASRLRQQATQLHAYRNEYRARHPAQGGRIASIGLLRCHQDFMARLEQAMTQQQDQLRAAEEQISALRAELVALETRVASVRKLIERRAAERERIAERQEQRRIDDAVVRRGGGDGPLTWRMAAPIAP